VNAATQRNWALPQTGGDWVLLLDSDEFLTPELADRIRDILANGTDCDGFRIKRMTIFFGKLIRHCGWHKQYVVRLWRSGKARHEDRSVAPRAIVDGDVGTIHEVMLHDTYRDMDDYVERVGRYTTWAANDLYAQGKKPSWLNLTFRPLWRFFRMYILRHGFLDGKHGLILCSLAVLYVFMKYARLWDMYRLAALGEDAAAPPPAEKAKAEKPAGGPTES